jgi:hypothetical protein
VTDVLSQRDLNRATLARQYLLERAPARAIEAIEHLGGMQSQAPLAPYVGLWTRLQDFAPDELSALTEERQVVRLHLMRNTVHLVSVRDAISRSPAKRLAITDEASPLALRSTRNRLRTALHLRYQSVVSRGPGRSRRRPCHGRPCRSLPEICQKLRHA